MICVDGHECIVTCVTLMRVLIGLLNLELYLV